MSSRKYNIHQAKSHLSRLIDEVEHGNEVTICRAGKPVARLMPLEKDDKNERTPGGLEGQIWVSDDFDEPDEDLIKAFEVGG